MIEGKTYPGKKREMKWKWFPITFEKYSFIFCSMATGTLFCWLQETAMDILLTAIYNLWGKFDDLPG